MAKEIIKRFLLGFLFAEPLGTFINLCVSFGSGNGSYIAVMPQLLEHFKTENGAVLCQTILVGLIGSVFAVSAMVFNIESWSTLKQYTVHFFVTSVFYTPFVMLCWMPRTLLSVLIMLVNFFFTYALTYTIQYRSGKKAVDKINAKLKEVHGNECN